MTSKKKTGRPSHYDKARHPRLAYLLMYGGASEDEICKLLAINRSNWDEWKLKNAEFSESIERGRNGGRDLDVENALLKSALGYETSEETVEGYVNPVTGETVPTSVRKTKKQVEPKPSSIAFWLKNRNPKKWRDQVDMIHSGVIDQRIQYYLPVNGRDMHLQPVIEVDGEIMEQRKLKEGNKE